MKAESAAFDAPGALRRRLALVLVGLTVAAAGLLGAGYWAVERLAEQQSLSDLLDGELDHLIASDISPVQTQGETTLRYFRSSRGATPPAELVTLTPGRYSEVLIAGQPYRILVRDIAPGDRAWLIFNVAGLERRERWLLGAVIGGVCAIALLAWRLSRRLAAAALAPLDQFVAQIRALDPQRRGQRLTEEPHNELREIAQALNAYMTRLDGLIERERAFAAAASHELRTPLTVIQGAAELLAERPLDTAPAVGRIQRAVIRARDDLEALLALARGVTVPGQPIDLRECLPIVAEPHLACATSGTRVVWNMPQPQQINASHGDVAIVFSNLLRNALRAADQVERGLVVIELSAAGFTVQDNGLGIAAADLPHVFEPWLAGRDGGSGIGLYIARTVAERMGWQIAIENTVDGGVLATVMFALGNPGSQGRV